MISYDNTHEEGRELDIHVELTINGKEHGPFASYLSDYLKPDKDTPQHLPISLSEAPVVWPEGHDAMKQLSVILGDKGYEFAQKNGRLD